MQKLLMSMKRKINLFIFPIFILLFYSCDNIKEGDYLISMPATPVYKNVLLEDYTGVKCPNCPEAAGIAAELKRTYGDSLIIVSIHAGVHARPSGIFADFRTEAGDAYNAYYKFLSYPSGLVDRYPYAGDVKLDRYEWGAAVKERMSRETSVNMYIENSWNEANREVTITVETSFINDEIDKDALALQLWIIEDSIVSPQIIDTNINRDYVHRHMFRDAVNGIWGSDLSDNDKNKEYVYVLHSEWEVKHCSIVAFIYNKEDKSILQCIEKEIVP
jgi:hypothetical protein